MSHPSAKSPSSTHAIILFCDLVGYSKLSTAQQEALFVGLTAGARRTCFELANQGNAQPTTPNDRLPAGFRGLPTGDGFALVVDSNTATDGHEAALLAFDRVVRVAVELHHWAEETSQADKDQPQVALRIGIHAGQVLAVRDINGIENACGAAINTTARIMAAAPPGGTWVSQEVVSDLLGAQARSVTLGNQRTCTIKAEAANTLRAKHGLTLVAHPLLLVCGGKKIWATRHAITLSRAFLCYPASPHPASDRLIKHLRDLLDRLGLDVVEPPSTPQNEVALRSLVADVDVLIAVAVPYDTTGVARGAPTSAWVHNFVGAARGGSATPKSTWVISQKDVDVSGWGALTDLHCPIRYDPDDRGTLTRIAEQTERQIQRWRRG